MTKAHVLYDRDCAFCRKSIALLAKLDWLGKLDYANVDETQPILKEPCRRGAAPEQMVALPADGRHLHGGYLRASAGWHGVFLRDLARARRCFICPA